MMVHPIRTMLFAAYLGLAGCEASSVATVPAQLGVPSQREVIVAADNIGPIAFEKRIAATWEVPLSGLLNLEHPKAVAAGIEDRSEPIEVYVYVLRHPSAGTFIVDSGISERFTIEGGNPDLSSIVAMAMKTDLLEVELSTADLAEELGGIDGVFLSHIHIDHIMGLSDLAKDTPVYIGPGDASFTAALNAFSQGTTDRLLGVQDQLREWQYGGGKVLDVLGDASLFAIHSPGHTPGSTAYLVMSTEGPQLLLGDATHTRWGWENGVEPGTFSADVPQSAESLVWLVNLAAEIPNITVHPGHQSLP
jgi:glyoxylase-like metal-dependent hydrolase (beta-lactamase superfamily II)